MRKARNELAQQLTRLRNIHHGRLRKVAPPTKIVARLERRDDMPVIAYDGPRNARCPCGSGLKIKDCHEASLTGKQVKIRQRQHAILRPKPV